MEGIQFIVDIQDRLEGALAASESLKKLYEDAEKADHGVTKLERDMDHAGRMSRNAAGAHDAHAHSALNLGHAFDGAREKVMGFSEAIGLVLAFEGVEKLIDLVKELGSEILHAGASEQRSNLAFEFAFGAEKAEELLGYMDQFRKASEFNEDTVKDMMLQLSRAGFAAAELPRAMAAAGDIAARFTDKTAGLSSALMALSTLKTTGRIEGRQFKALGLGEENAEAKFFAVLSRRTGVGVEALKKQMQDGKVKLEDAQEALYSIIAGERGVLGAGVVKAGQGMAAKLTHFREIPELIFESVEKSPAFARFATFIGEMTEKLGPEGPLGSKLATGLGHAFDAVATKLSQIDEKDIEGFVMALAKLPGVIADLTNALVKLVPVASKAAGAVSVLMDDSDKSTLGNPAIGNAPLIGPAYTAWRLFKAAISDDDAAKNAAHAQVQGLESTMLADGPKIYRVGAGAAQQSIAGFKGPQGIDSHSPSKKFAHLGRMSAEGFEEGLNDGVDAMDIAAPSRRMLGSVADVAAPVAGGAGSVSVSAPVTVNVSGTESTPEQIAEVIRVEVPSAILAALEQIGLQGGQA